MNKLHFRVSPRCPQIFYVTDGCHPLLYSPFDSHPLFYFGSVFTSGGTGLASVLTRKDRCVLLCTSCPDSLPRFFHLYSFAPGFSSPFLLRIYSVFILSVVCVFTIGTSSRDFLTLSFPFVWKLYIKFF